MIQCWDYGWYMHDFRKSSFSYSSPNLIAILNAQGSDTPYSMVLSDEIAPPSGYPSSRNCLISHHLKTVFNALLMLSE